MCTGLCSCGMASVDSFYVTRTMEALEVLAFRSSSAPELASILRVDARTARRLLNRLTDDGWLTRTEGRVRTYSLSMRLLALAAHFADRAPIGRAAAAAVDALHERTGATAHLVIPSYRCVLCLVHRAGGPGARPQLRELVPAHASAGGKVLLGHREAWRESVLELPLDRLTERTVVDPAAVREQAAAAVARGFATEDGEYRKGLQSIAAPVQDGAGDVLGALTLTAPASLGVLEQVDAVLEAADAVTARLADA